MKKIAFSLGCLAFGLAAPVVCTAQEAASVPATQDTAAQDAAIRSYMLKAVACMMDSAAAQMENLNAEPVSAFVNNFEEAHKAVAAIPTDGLPEQFKAYLNESQEISKEFVEQCRPLIPAEGGEATEEVVKEVQAIQLETQVQLAQLEEKYPEVAAKIGREALKDFTDKITGELSLKERAAEWAEENKEELEAKGPAAMACVLRFLASELRKEADK